MSRTYRQTKKNGSFNWKWHSYEWEYNGSYMYKRYFVEGSLEYRKAKARFHSDAAMDGHSYRWFEREHRRGIKMLNKQELNRYFKIEDYEPMFVDNKRGDKWWY